MGLLRGATFSWRCSRTVATFDIGNGWWLSDPIAEQALREELPFSEPFQRFALCVKLLFELLNPLTQRHGLRRRAPLTFERANRTQCQVSTTAESADEEGEPNQK